MKKHVLKQVCRLLSLIEEKDIPPEQLEALNDVGLFSMLLDANVDQIDKEKFREVCGLKPLSETGFDEKVVTGIHVQIVSGHVIDSDTDPFVPEGLTLKSHKKGGQIHWEQANYKSWFHPKQEGGFCTVSARELFKWMEDKPGYNVNVLDYWLAHPEIIPEECKDKWTYFPNTVYSDSQDKPIIRCFYYSDGGQPRSDTDSLDYYLDQHCPAAGSVK
jgi:hypothetical protein